MTLLKILFFYCFCKLLRSANLTPESFKSMGLMEIFASHFNGNINGYFSYTDIKALSATKGLGESFQFIVASTRPLNILSYQGLEIPSFTLGLPKNYDWRAHNTPLTTSQIEEILSRPRIVVVGYFGANEGVSVVQGVYFIYTLLHSVVNGHEEIIEILKNNQIQVIPALNVDRLKERNMMHINRTSLNTYKNLNNFGFSSCNGSIEIGVRLRYNYGPEFKTSTNPCSYFYPGEQIYSEKETKAILQVITDQLTNQVFGLFNGEHLIEFTGADRHDNLALNILSSIIDTDFSIQDPLESSAPGAGEFISDCNSIQKRICFGINISPSIPSDDYFQITLNEIESEVIKASIPVFRLMALNSIHPLFRFGNIQQNICANSEFRLVCGDNSLIKEVIYSLHIEVANIGNLSIINRTVSLALGEKYTVKNLVLNSTSGELSLLGFNLIPYSVSKQRRWVEFLILSLKPQEKLQFLVIFTIPQTSRIEPLDEFTVDLKLNKPSDLIALYLKSKNVADLEIEIYEDNKVEIIIEPEIDEPDIFGARAISYYILAIYIAVSACFYLGAGIIAIRKWIKMKKVLRYADSNNNEHK